MLWLWGWHVFKSVLEHKKRKIYKINILKNHYEKVIELTKHLNIEISIVNNHYMNLHYGTSHQGIALKVEQITMYSLKDWLEIQSNKEKVVLVASDLLEDPYNLGAIIRTGAALGADGLLITKKKSVPINGAVAKAAAGALEILPIIQVSNLACALTSLKEFQYKVYGLDHRGKVIFNVHKKSVIILGQEGAGLRELTKKRCDDIISIHTKTNFSVLNVSVTAGIILHEFCVRNH